MKYFSIKNIILILSIYKNIFNMSKKIINLQKKEDIKLFLIDVKKVYNSKSYLVGKKYSYTFSKNNKKEKQIFNLNICKKTEGKKLYLEMKITDAKNGVCLTMSFHNKKQHSKYKTIITFKKSKIELLNKGKCGYDKKKKTVDMSGSFVLNLANTLNDILEVDVAILEDDSRLEICESNVSLKILNLLKYGKTWYERAGGYSLNDKEIYTRAKLVGDMTVKQLYDTLLEIDNDILKHDIFDFSVIKGNTIKKVEKILDSMGESKRTKVKTIFSKAFDRNSKLSECDQKFLWDHILQLNPRKYITKNNSGKYKIMKDYYKFINEAHRFTPSTRKIKK